MSLLRSLKVRWGRTAVIQQLKKHKNDTNKHTNKTNNKYMYICIYYGQQGVTLFIGYDVRENL